MHYFAEESDNVKARELLFLQEKRQLKKYVGEMQKEVRIRVVCSSIYIYIIRSSNDNTLYWKAARGRHAPLRNVQWRQLSTIYQQYKVGILIFDL